MSCIKYEHCGSFAYGVVRVYCDTCRQSDGVAVSCKGRARWPSCTGRRMPTMERTSERWERNRRHHASRRRCAPACALSAMDADVSVGDSRHAGAASGARHRAAKNHGPAHRAISAPART
ncbi:MAG: transposase zinc-binding domain-containing protein [Kofleriaceae bacterium]|nr:transposase zinc-binding domain-containing protein [Kofleriaceae bacterium]